VTFGFDEAAFLTGCSLNDHPRDKRSESISIFTLGPDEHHKNGAHSHIVFSLQLFEGRFVEG
jgi:hypothetical protein